jgi:glycosyltransferase involved in cell wall biosynthesis
LENNSRAVKLFHLGVRLAGAVVVQTPEQVELCRERFGREPVLIKSLAEAQPLRAGMPEAFVWAGRLAGYKHPEVIVTVAKALPEARFWMVAVATGEEEQGRLESLMAAAERLENLEVLAPRPREELGELIAKSVAVVNTAEYEGMPNVFLEGWARGVPALALSHDPDGVIARERLGSFAEGSLDRLIELARELWAGRGGQSELAQRCRAYIQREHSMDTALDRWEHVLRLGEGR